VTLSTVDVGQIERPSQSLEPETIGLSLEEGKRLLRSLQQAIVRSQTEEICALRRGCQGCHRWTKVKDYQQRKVDTVFGAKDSAGRHPLSAVGFGRKLKNALPIGAALGARAHP
jgi:hypothetical protein